MSNNIVDKAFFDWFVGFFEAEGSFTVSKRGDLQIVITQGYANISVLYYIKQVLGYGHVYKQSARVFRYVVQDKDNLIKILEILNGNLVLQHRIDKLSYFVEQFNTRYELDLKAISIRRLITLNDGWLCGFCDGDGCFSVSWLETKKQFKTSFIVSQLEDLLFIKQILSEGNCEYNKSNGCCSFVIYSLSNWYKFKFQEVIDYFSKFSLKTTKRNSFHLWYYVVNQIYFNELTAERIASIKGLSKLINN